MRSLSKYFLLAAVSVFGAHLAVSDPLYSFTSANNTFSDDPATLGFVFTSNHAFEVDSLGWYDPSGSGFATAHTVGIFDSTGNLLTSATLAAGTDDALSNGFRYHAITPIVLASDAQYTLAGTTGGSEDRWTVNDQVNGFSVNPSFTIGANAARYAYGSTLVDPTSHFSDYLVYAGPNLEGHDASSATPEPASILLLTFAALCFLGWKVRPVRSCRGA